jgi:hypothetical protein
MDLLLRDGWTFSDPDDRILKAAERLCRLGLIETGRNGYVICADPRDGDFPPPSRHCQGRIRLDETLDDGGDEFHCPDCGRVVHPFLHEKQRHVELRSHLIPEGAVAFLMDEVESLGDYRELAGGVFRCDHVDGDVIVCLLEACREGKYLSRDFAAQNPTVYVAIDARNRDQRLLSEEWLTGTTLAALVNGEDDLAVLMDRTISSGSPATMAHVSLPVYDKVVPTIIHGAVRTQETERRFVVEFGTDFIRVNGLLAVKAKAEAQLRVFGILWQRFLEDLMAGRTSDEFRPMNLDRIADAFQGNTSREAIDATAVRRNLNRLQNDLIRNLRKEGGIPVERHDIIENLQGEGQSRRNTGYRINPLTVLPRAARPT